MLASGLPRPSQASDSRVVLILVGLVGSGKSTFAQALERHVPHFRRCNQDDLAGDRRQVEALARSSLSRGLSVCIDRTNFDASQRSTWIKIAHEFPGTSVWVIVFDTPYEVCAERLRSRTTHPTIKTPEQGLSILARFSSQYQPPSQHEGYSRFINLPLSDQLPEYSSQDVLAILDRVRNASPASESLRYPPPASRSHRVMPNFRGNFNTSFRGAPRAAFGSGFRTPYYRPHMQSTFALPRSSREGADVDDGDRSEATRSAQL